ncbi:hypothetical protein JEZ13_05530 [bacterium]|nr:hypothetical protein [bacterium]
MIYEPQMFVNCAETELGKKLWDFLNKPETFIRMETATNLNKTAVEGFAKEMLRIFEDEFALLKPFSLNSTALFGFNHKHHNG